MASRGRSTRRRAGTQPKHSGAAGTSDRGDPQDQISTSRYCAVCFLTFGSREKRAVQGGKATHLKCVEGLAQAEVT